MREIMRSWDADFFVRRGSRIWWIAGKTARRARLLGVGSGVTLERKRLCCLVADRCADFGGEFRRQFVHAMGRARVLGALLQDFLFGFAFGDEVAIHADVTTIDGLGHPLTS